MTATPRRLLAIKKEEKHIRTARAPLSFELLHDLEELIVRVLLVLQALLELAEVRERLLLAQRVVRRCLLHRGRGHALHGLRHTSRSPRVRFCVGRSAPPDASPGKVAFERALSNRGAGGRRGARDVRPSIERVLPRAALSALEEARGSLPLPKHRASLRRVRANLPYGELDWPSRPTTTVFESSTRAGKQKIDRSRDFHWFS